MLVLLDPLFVTFTDQQITVFSEDFDPDKAFTDLGIVQQRIVARQMVAVRDLIRTVLNEYEKARTG